MVSRGEYEIKNSSKRQNQGTMESDDHRTFVHKVLQIYFPRLCRIPQALNTELRSQKIGLSSFDPNAVRIFVKLDAVQEDLDLVDAWMQQYL